ncbi:MAG: PilZ domain-containing protein [Candidatus Korobacteraceae bacterium]
MTRSGSFDGVSPLGIGPQMKQTHRRHIRHAVEAPLLVRGIGSSVTNSLRGHCVDLSEGGAGCMVPGEWPPGQVVTMEMTLPGMENSLVLSARVCYRNGLRYGFEFLAPSKEALTAIRVLCPQA